VAQPAHLVTVQATKQPGPFGTLLLHIMPTFLLQNSLPVTLQYKQAGSSTVMARRERSLRFMCSSSHGRHR
jgi:hypothetical protein